MNLLIPETGLLFWMLISFGIVFFVLAKWGFPVINKMVAQRKEFIDKSMEAAREANRQLAEIRIEGEAILNESRRERAAILAEASETKRRVVEQARDEAAREAKLQVDKAREDIARAKEGALREIRGEIALLALQVAEKVLREKLDDGPEQIKVIDSMLDQMKDIKLQ